MRRTLAVLTVLFLMLPVARCEPDPQFSGELNLYGQTRPIFSRAESRIMELFNAGDWDGAYDLAAEEFSALNEERPLEDWDGALCYASPEELALYRELEPDEPLSEDYNDYPALLYSIGFLLIDSREYQDAQKYLEFARRMDPMGIMIAKELINCHLAAGDLERARALLEEARPLCVLPEDIGWYYRRLGYILYEEGDPALSRYCQLYSLIFEDSELAYGELAYVDAAMGNDPFDYRGESAELDSLLEEVVADFEERGMLFYLEDAQVAVLYALAEGYEDAAFDAYRDALAFYEGMDESVRVM